MSHQISRECYDNFSSPEPKPYCIYSCSAIRRRPLFTISKIFFPESKPHREERGTEVINEPPHGKTNNVVSEQVLHKSGCTVTEAG